MTAVTDAYVACAAITREQARNFHYGIRLLPPAKRDALCAVYALARRVDDIGDGDLPIRDKLRLLAELRGSLARLDEAHDKVLIAVRDAARHYPIPLAAFDELIDGVEMDVRGTRYETFGDLERYCRCVAGSIGRLCIGVFGTRDPRAAAHADALGIALQQTNILRDLREDFMSGRVYIPAEDLDRFRVRLCLDGGGRLVDEDGRLTALVRCAADRARAWYDDGLRVLTMLDRRSAACCGAMAGIYRRLLDDISADPSLVFGKRLSLTGWQKTVVAARAVAGWSP